MHDTLLRAPWGKDAFTRQPGHGVGGKDGRCLVPRVHDADAQLLACHQYGGDVAADQREDILDFVRTQNLGDALPAVARALCISLAAREERESLTDDEG